MQLKKIALVFLVVIMMFSLAAISIAAEGETSGFSISAKVESEGAIASENGLVIKSGNDIKYVVSVDSNPGELSWLEIRAEFDNEILKFKGFTFGELFDTQKCVAKPINEERANESGLIQVMLRTEEDYVSNETGNFITLEFEVSEGFDGDIEKLDLTYIAYRLGNGDVVEPAVTATDAFAIHALDAGTKAPGDCKNVGTTTYKCTHEGCDYELVLHDGELGDHNLVKVEKVEPTVDRPGNEEHYECSVCNKFFDAEGNEISYPSIPQLEKPRNDRNNTAVTVIIIVVAVVVVAAGAAAAVVVLKKKKIL